MNNKYILKYIEKDRPFKTEKECIEYYMDECWVKQDVASDLFYYKVIIDKAIEYINEESKSLNAGLSIKKCINVYELLNILRGEDNDKSE